MVKTDSSEMSTGECQRDKVTVGAGGSNPVAVKNLGAMKQGDRLIIYETGDHKSAVGTASLVSVDASDPKNPAVQIKAGKPIAKPITLGEIKSNKLFKDSPLVRIGRLSLVPLTEAQYKFLAGVCFL